MTTHLPALGPVHISPLTADERVWVLDSWMRGTRWTRGRIVRAMDEGQVLVARDSDAEGAFAYGWLCRLGEAVAHAAVKRDFRDLGVAKALWRAAGEPGELMEPATRVGRRVMRKLTGDRE